MKRITILLDDATLDELEQRQRETGATLSGQIRVAVNRWLGADVAVRGASVPVSEMVEPVINPDGEF